MKLLIITQKIDENDDVLGFFHRWAEEFSKNCEKVVVVSQYIGSYNFPKNVEVFSMGKEKGFSKIRQLLNFYKLLFKKLPEVNAVFVHMVPLWVVLGMPVFKIFRKKVYLWYTHKSVNFTLRLAEKIVSKIFAASKKSFRLKSDKIIITGHGIDAEKFKYSAFQKNPKFRIISVGRIAPIKNYEVLIGAAEILKNNNFDFEISIAGKPAIKEDEKYFEKLKKLIKEKKLEDKIDFVGAIPYSRINEFYQGGNLFVNFSDTGSIDKTVLEAMASGLFVLTSNEAFKNILAPQYITSKNPQEIAGKIIALSKSESDQNSREYVIKNHNLKNLINCIIKEI